MTTRKPSASPASRQQWLGELADRIRNVHAADPPAHVLHRLASILHREPLLFVDNDLRSEETGHRSGRLVVFTQRMVAVVDLEHEWDDIDGPRPDDGQGSVIVTVMPRTSLSAIDVSTVPEFQHNSADSWADAEVEWPPYYGGRVGLSYPALGDSVAVPTDFREDFYAFLPSLLDDLVSS